MEHLSRNRLGEEESPYLRQHADNPVNWQPWDEEALRAAKETARPIFLSIGYSSCHWCHVMEEESFQDTHVARVLNERYVPVKVDREERPDVDRIYQTLSQMVSGGGGWPLSVWLTPELEPFYVGTYFPRRSQRGRTGFLDLLSQLAERWEGDRSALKERAEKWSDALKAGMEEEAASTGSGVEVGHLLRSAWEEAMARSDGRNGGFGGRPKFPQPRQVDLLFRAFAATGDEGYRDQALLTLDRMAAGGIYDQVGGGFHRYSTDSEWVVPHFEKMLYDNAEIPRLYLSAHRVTGEEAYASIVEETFEFLEREMRHPGGGYYATLDARSEGEEGLFYTWTPDEVRAALDDGAAAEAFLTRYGVTAEGNFEGRTVLTLSASVEEVAEELGMEPEEAGHLLSEAEEEILEAREERTRPDRDEKVLAGWNGLTISALAEAGLVVDETYLDDAAECLGFLEEKLWSDGVLYRRYIDGETGVEGYLEDYAFLGRGALDLYGATGEVEHLSFARRLADCVLAEFRGEDGRLYLAPERSDLLARPSDLDDSSTPSSVGSAVQLLLLLSHFFPGHGYGEAADAALNSARGRAEASPFGHPSLAVADHLSVEGARELTLATDTGVPPDWRREIGGSYLPDLLLAPRPATEEGLGRWVERLGLEESPPIWRGRRARDGEVTGYGCAGRTCSPPSIDPAETLDWLEER